MCFCTTSHPRQWCRNALSLGGSCRNRRRSRQRDLAGGHDDLALLRHGSGWLGGNLSDARGFRTRDTSSKPSTPVAQKRRVVMAAFRLALSWRTSISSISTQGHLVNLGLLQDRLELQDLPKTYFLITDKPPPCHQAQAYRQACA